MERKYYACLEDITAENFEQVLRSISCVGNHQYELVLNYGTIEKICKEKDYPCYKFGHNLEGDSYMRVRVNIRTTLEILVRNKSQDEGEALVLQIVQNGQVLYRKPQNPKKAIIVN